MQTIDIFREYSYTEIMESDHSFDDTKEGDT